MSKRVVKSASSRDASGSGKKNSANLEVRKKAAKKKAVKRKSAANKRAAVKKPVPDSKKQKSTSKKKAASGGLVSAPKKVSVKRPSRPSARQSPDARIPIDVRVDYEPLEISTHGNLAQHYGTIAQRINEQPELSILLLINPILALKELNIKASKAISNHILQAMQHTPHLKKRREMLETELTEKLGEKPQPNNPRWLANLLFQELKLKPLDTGDEKPVYRSALEPERLEALQKLRPRPRQKYKAALKRKGNLRLQVAQWDGAVRRMDIDAPVPELEVSATVPKEISLETLFFYKDSSPELKKLLELGIIQRQGYPIHTGDSYRKIKNGSKANAFRAWIRSVKFPDE